MTHLFVVVAAIILAIVLEIVLLIVFARSHRKGTQCNRRSGGRRTGSVASCNKQEERPCEDGLQFEVERRCAL
jgi:hypothetical protein